MVFMKPIDTADLTTDDDIDRLIAETHALIAKELETVTV